MKRLLTVFIMLVVALPVHAHNGIAVPEDVWSHWDLNPTILIALLLPTYLYGRGALGYHVSAGRSVAFLGGMGTLFVALMSPLDAMSGALFSAHMGQHLLLILVAAPLLVWSHPLPSLLRGLPANSNRVFGKLARVPLARTLWHNLTQPMNALVLHIAAIALWHVPLFYSAAFQYPIVHLLEHASFFLSAALFWWVIRRNAALGTRVFAIFTVMMVSGLLGALMTFASSAWYPDHVQSAALWGLTALEDQRLAGLLMWIPSGLVYVGFAAVILVLWLETQEQRNTVLQIEGVSDAP